MSTRPWAQRGALLASGLLLAGCVTPATGAASYEGKAKRSVEDASSEVGTARLVLRTVLDGRIFRATADETVSANEQALGSIQDSFGAVQPPRGQDQLHDDTNQLLSDAEDALVAARIAVRRSDREATQQALAELDAVSDRLDAAQGAS